ncbi:MAG: hypothetical protein H7196_04780 [candidate division SR1 bacterium]|nr:hypothetical protein [candidate division SR1 bacterium]
MSSILVSDYPAQAQSNPQVLLCTKYHFHNQIVIDCDKTPDYDPTQVNVQVNVNSANLYSVYNVSRYYIYDSSQHNLYPSLSNFSLNNQYIKFNSISNFSQSYQKYP